MEEKIYYVATILVRYLYNVGIFLTFIAVIIFKKVVKSVNKVLHVSNQSFCVLLDSGTLKG